MKKHITLIEVAELFEIEHLIVIEMIQQEWINPVAERMFDDEDIARIQLILDLRNKFAANDESIPLILHLMDQLYSLRNQMSHLGRLK